MAVQKLTPRHLNKDDDERLVKATEMTDALNVRVSSDDNGDALVLKNAYGNTEITLQTALPAGTNKVIGSVASEQSNSIYYFVWNSNNDHSIYKYSVGTKKAQQVYKDSVLSFNTYSLYTILSLSVSSRKKSGLALSGTASVTNSSNANCSPSSVTKSPLSKSSNLITACLKSSSNIG